MGARGLMGRRKTEERDDWEIVCRTVVQGVEKLCEVVFCLFFRRRYFFYFYLDILVNFFDLYRN